VKGIKGKGMYCSSVKNSSLLLSFFQEKTHLELGGKVLLMSGFKGISTYSMEVSRF